MLWNDGVTKYSWIFINQNSNSILCDRSSLSEGHLVGIQQILTHNIIIV